MARALNKMKACCCRPSSSSSSSISSTNGIQLAGGSGDRNETTSRHLMKLTQPGSAKGQDNKSSQRPQANNSTAPAAPINAGTNSKQQQQSKQLDGTGSKSAKKKESGQQQQQSQKKLGVRKRLSMSRDDCDGNNNAGDAARDGDCSMNGNSAMTNSIGGKQACQSFDLSHQKLNEIPLQVIIAQVSDKSQLEELNFESNNIQELPRQLFQQFKHLKRLYLSDNDIHAIPSYVSQLGHLETLYVSKNQLKFISDEIRKCRQLASLELSVNPLNKLPECLFQLQKLQELYINDIYLEHLPANIGKLTELRVLEVRENDLKTLPKSMARLTKLRCLDLGQNELSHVPEVLGQLIGLEELWIDSNQIKYLPEFLGRLKRLKYFDCSKNQLAYIDQQFFKCFELKDLIMSQNNLQHLPATICDLYNLNTLKLDDNELIDLPAELGSLNQLEELVISNNRIQALPNSIGQLTSLKILLTDMNALVRLPQTIGQCTSLRILNVASNNLLSLPDEIGYLTDLRVLNLTNNYLRCLPKSIVQLSKLTALWLNDNQKKPLILLQLETDERTQNQVLTCLLFPQTGPIFGPVSPAAAASLIAHQHQLQQQQQQLGQIGATAGSGLNEPGGSGQPTKVIQQVAIGVQQRLQHELQANAASKQPIASSAGQISNQVNPPVASIATQQQQQQVGHRYSLQNHSPVPLDSVVDQIKCHRGSHDSNRAQQGTSLAAAIANAAARTASYHKSNTAPAHLRNLPSTGSFGLMDDEDEDARGAMLQMSNSLSDTRTFNSIPSVANNIGASSNAIGSAEQSLMANSLCNDLNAIKVPPMSAGATMTIADQQNTCWPR